VVLFRKKVQKEKAMLGIFENDSSSCSPASASTLITVHRSRIVEDGYRQLATLSSNGMKGIIRWGLLIGWAGMCLKGKYEISADVLWGKNTGYRPMSFWGNQIL
jgi:hypothetical protein